MSRELGVSTNALREWAKRADLDAGRRTDGLTSDEREELGRLRRANKVLTEEREILAKAAAFLRRGDRSDPVTMFGFIERQKAEHHIATMARILGVSRSGTLRPADGAQDPACRGSRAH